MQRENAMQRENIEAIYPLLEMQQGFLFNHQLDPQSGSLVVRCELTGALEVPVFQAAWDMALQRHEMLRCSIHTRDEKPPMLVVWKQVSQPIQVEMDLPSGDQQARDTWVSQLEQRPLALDEAPLGSVHLLPLSDDRHELVWRVHHIVLDGWSAAVVLREVVSSYNQRMQGSTSRLSPPGRYRDYMAYRRARDTEAERSYWQRSMDGFGGMPRLPWSSVAEATAPRPRCSTRELSVEDSARLAQLSTDGITPNALAVGCWGLVQASLFNTDDVVTGIATAGRAADVAAIESLVGLVANTIPVRTPIPRDENLGEWLRRLRDEQFERQSFEMVSIDDVEAWCQLNRDRALFECLLVVENFPTSNEETGLKLEGFESGIVSAYPLTLCVVPGARWRLKLLFDERRVPHDTAERVLTDVAQRLRDVPAGLSEPVGAFTGRTTSSRRMEVNGKETRASLVGPRTDVQKRLASIWKRVLGRDVGVRANFFEAGGRSLSAVRMLASVEEEFGQLHSPGVLMQHPTIEALAEVITRDQPSS
ncbi:MAG: condensation domain-containing protein, partial [Planctomycetota bacterium]